MTDKAGNDRTFTAVSRTMLADSIRNARRRIVYVAPGIWNDVATALGERFAELDRLDVCVIIDADAEVCRLGYGDRAGLLRIHRLANQYHFPIQQQPGLRIGMLMIDEKVVVYAPVPEQIEAGPTHEARQPNGILLDPASATRVASACGADPDSAPGDAEIGQQGLDPDVVSAVAQDLAENPPQRFDLTRALRVFSSKLQYVELKISDYKLQSRRISIPPELSGMADNELRTRWRNAIQLLDKGDDLGIEIDGKPYGPVEIDEERKKIEKQYLIKLAKHGVFILRKNRSAFDADIERFEAQLSKYSEALEARWSHHLESLARKVAEQLFPQLTQNPPPDWRRLGIEDDDDRKSWLQAAILMHFKRDAGQVVPKLAITFKELTVETIRDESFRAEIARQLQGHKVTEWFAEFEAIRGSAN